MGSVVFRHAASSDKPHPNASPEGEGLLMRVEQYAGQDQRLAEAGPELPISLNTWAAMGLVRSISLRKLSRPFSAPAPRTVRVRPVWASRTVTVPLDGSTFAMPDK